LQRKVIPYTRYISILGVVVIAGAIACYIYLLHIGEAQRLLRSVRSFGIPGVILGILIQSLVNILPVPGEFTSIVLMEIYGPVWGGIYSWIGGLAGAIGGLYVTRWVAKPFFGAMAQPFLQRVEEFIAKREVLGLLLLRFVPFVPYHLVNYAAGLLNVKLSGFVWTTALGILPYTVAMSGIYAGVRQGSLVWGIVGGGIFALLIGISWYAKREKGGSR
jgi:uncharacterized membrane protein YdjX (TVP38/TMEM64 family)